VAMKACPETAEDTFERTIGTTIEEGASYFCFNPMEIVHPCVVPPNAN